MRKFFYALSPLGVLLVAISLASVIAFLVLSGLGDVVTMNKLVSKGTQVLLILSIVPFMRFLHIGWGEIGFSRCGCFFKQVGLGLGVGLLTLLPVMFMLYFFGVKQFSPEFSWAIGSLFKALLGTLLVGMLVAFAEEPLFRGLLLTSLQRKLTVGLAILVSAIYYAALHFLRSDNEIPFDQITFLSGFVLAGKAFLNLFSTQVFSAFLALLMVGVFLGLLRTQIKQSLGLCIGCHAAWVWQIKMNKKMFVTDVDSEWYYLVSGYDGVIGPLVTSWLLLVVLGYFGYRHFHEQ